MRRPVSALGALALFLLAGLSGFPQDRKTEPAAVPAGQQDKIEITQVLDSWYKVVQLGTLNADEKPVGFVHEVLTRTQPGSNYRFQYELTGEADVMVASADKSDKLIPETHAVHIRASLDDTYAPIVMERHDQKGAGMLPTTVYSEDNVRKIEIQYAGERKSFNVNPDEEIFYSHFLMFVALRQSGALSKPGTRKAILMQPREDGAPPYAEVTLEIKEMTKREVMGKKDVSVTPVTFLKPPPAASPMDEILTVFVDKYGRVVEEETRGRTRRLLVKTEKDALGDRPMIVSARRDPFWKGGAFSKGGGGGKDAKGGEKPSKDPDQFPKNLAEAKAKLEDLAKAKAENREADGEKLYQRILDLIDAMMASNAVKPLAADALAQVEDITVQAEKIWGGVARVMKAGQLLFVRCTQLFEKDDCPGMEAGLKELKALTARRELKNYPAKLAELQKWIGQVEPLVQRCKTRIDLAKKKIVLTGTTLSEVWEQVPVDVRLSVFGHQAGSVLDVRFVRPIRIAILNGKPYRVGDTVDGEGVRVEKIWAHGVQVSLRDETRDVGIRQ